MNLDVRGSSSTGSGGRLGEVSAGPHSAANFYGYGEWRLESGHQSPTVTIMWTHGVPSVQMWNIFNFQHIYNLQHKAPTELDVSPNI